MFYIYSVQALVKLYALSGPTLSSIIVDGDEIPYETTRIITRSMSKKSKYISIFYDQNKKHTNFQ